MFLSFNKKMMTEPFFWTLFCVCSFSLTHITSTLWFRGNGTHSVVTCIAGLQKKSNYKQMRKQTRWNLETQKNREHGTGQKRDEGKGNEQTTGNIKRPEPPKRKK